MKTYYWFNPNRLLSHLRIATAGRRPHLRPGFVLTALALALAGLVLSPQARAVCQQGCDLTNHNTFLGDDALLNNTTGFNNTATGGNALVNNTTGSNNTANGYGALESNTTGAYNTANGYGALFSNTTGDANTANGVNALVNNTTGFQNTANGVNALFSNTTGTNNTAEGVQALNSNTTGNYNTANGVSALALNTTGHDNTANGRNALYYNTTGNWNTAEGLNALLHNTGTSNIALGFNAGVNLTNGRNNIDIGAPGVAGEASTIRIGVQGTQARTFVAGISGSPITGTSVVVSGVGRLGTVASSQRFKDDIKPMDKASEAILALKPVTFHYKKEVDPDGIPQFGLVAEQVEEVNPDLVARDEKGKVYTVRYDAVNAMLLNEFLREHRKVQEQGATIIELKSSASKQEATIAQLNSTVAQQQKGMDLIAARLKDQDSKIQKVSAQLETSKSAPQLALDRE